jgi:hypothetical protein
MIRINGFTITIYADKVVATQGNVSFTFKTIEDAMNTLSQ